MKKILMVMALAMVLVWGVGVKGADATIWEPTLSGLINVNYVGTSAVVDFAIFDDSDSQLLSPLVTMSGGPLGFTDTIGLVANGANYDLTLNSIATGAQLTSSSLFQVGWKDMNGVWKIDTSYVNDGNVSKIFWNYSPESAVLFQIDAKPVPIPAAAWLLGSGLIGLIGIRRRKK